MKNNKLIYLLIALLAVWCIFLTTSSSKNNKQKNQTEVVNEYNVSGFSTDFTKVIDEHKSSIVTISCDGTISSGFVYKQIDDKVYVLTSHHGVTGDKISITFGDVYTSTGKVIGYDLYCDMAVIEVDSLYTIKNIKLGDSSIAKQGEFVVSIGTPTSIEFANSVELGMISKSNRIIENSITANDNTTKYYLNVIQLSANLKNGYSGSPVINMNGEVIGMITMSSTAGTNFAITSNEMKIVADKIINSEDYIKYQLGIKGTFIKQMDEYVKTNLNITVDTINGLYVEKLIETLPAYVLGIRSGDIILSINDITMNNVNDYLNVVYTKASVLKLNVLRNGEVINITASLDA